MQRNGRFRNEISWKQKSKHAVFGECEKFRVGRVQRVGMGWVVAVVWVVAGQAADFNVLCSQPAIQPAENGTPLWALVRGARVLDRRD